LLVQAISLAETYEKIIAGGPPAPALAEFFLAFDRACTVERIGTCGTTWMPSTSMTSTGMRR